MPSLTGDGVVMGSVPGVVVVGVSVGEDDDSEVVPVGGGAEVGS